MTQEPISIPTLERDASFSQFMDKPMKPVDEEIDFQSLFENNNYEKSLDPEDFSTNRGWWFRCRTCGGQTKLRTKHPYCRHCGFSQNSL